ncbi:MAG: hypothetical protein R3C49_21725 [Planctomycetaceae bacterium]
MNRKHLLGVGPTGSGKTTGEIDKIEPGMVFDDPHGTLAEAVVLKCGDKGIPQVVDCLPARMWFCLEVSHAGVLGDDYESEILRNELNYAFADIIARDQQQRDGIRANPLIEEWLLKALNAWHRHPVVSLAELDRVLDPMTDEFKRIECGELNHSRS